MSQIILVELTDKSILNLIEKNDEAAARHRKSACEILIGPVPNAGQGTPGVFLDTILYDIRSETKGVVGEVETNESLYGGHDPVQQFLLLLVIIDVKNDHQLLRGHLSNKHILYYTRLHTSNLYSPVSWSVSYTVK